MSPPKEDTKVATDPPVGTDPSVLLKAYFLGAESMGDSQGSNSLQDPANEELLWTQAGAIPPPYDPLALMKLLEHSNALRQNVDAYVTNIDGFGHRLEAIIDLDGEDAFEKVRDQLIAERERQADGAAGTAPGTLPVLPSDDEVTARTEVLREQMRVEKMKLAAFFEYLAGDISFVSLRRRLRQDLEVSGNGYIEVVRTVGGDVAELVHLPSYSMRLRKSESVETMVKIRGADLQFRLEKRRRRFRSYVQLAEQHTVFFKEFGDDRIVSSKTGKSFPELAAMNLVEPDVREATEVIHFRIYSSRSAYGIPRWIGNLISVLGSRAAEETNYLYFDNKSIPPLALLVSGGRFSGESVKRIEDYIKNEIRGRKNFHKILVLEAEGAAGAIDATGKMKIEIKPLTDAQQKDALFQNYDENNIDKVGMSFRLPRLLRGDIRDFNRATADAAMEFAEDQVFAPEREDFDHLINQRLLPDVGIRLWKFKSNGPTTQDPSELAIILERLVKADILIPEEAREVAEKILGRQFKRIDADWVRQPTSFTKIGIPLDAALDGDLELPPVPLKDNPGGLQSEAPAPVAPGTPPAGAAAPAAAAAPAPAVAAAQAFQAALRPKMKRFGPMAQVAIKLVHMRNELRALEQLEAGQAHARAQKNLDLAGDPERSV